MNHDDLKNSVAAYALGVLDARERASLEAHLQAGCSECQALLKDMRAVTAGLAYSAPPETPPVYLKEKVLQAVRELSRASELGTQETKAPIPETVSRWLEKSRRRWRSLSFGLAFVMVVLAVLFVWTSNRMQHEIDALLAQREINAELVEQLRAQLARKEEVLQVLRAPRVRLVHLEGQPIAPDSRAGIIWDPDSNRAFFVADNLPVPASDKDYQLWMLRGNQPVDAGVFTVDENGHAEVALETIPDGENLAAFAVTLEPKGGVPQPTGQMYLVGAVKS